MALTNCLFVRVFGELEFGFALLKIALIFIVNIMAIVIIAGGGPEGETLGFRYWKGESLFCAGSQKYDANLHVLYQIPAHSFNT
jgi:amino acid transporter